MKKNRGSEKQESAPAVLRIKPGIGEQLKALAVLQRAKERRVLSPVIEKELRMLLGKTRRNSEKAIVSSDNGSDRRYRWHYGKVGDYHGA